MNDDLKRVNLRDIVDRISENTIVLPDFQRGFTWKENNRQKALLASVLTKLPIGTVLFLNVKIKPKSDYPLKTLYPRAFQTGQNHLIYYDFTTVE